MKKRVLLFSSLAAAALVLSACNDYVGKEINLEFRGEEFDGDLCVPGSKCKVLAVDEEWLFVQITDKKGEREKLFRLSTISGVKGT